MLFKCMFLKHKIQFFVIFIIKYYIFDLIIYLFIVFCLLIMCLCLKKLVILGYL